MLMVSAAAAYHGLEIREDAREPQLRRYGRVVKLTPREYGIFELLFKRRPKPVTITDIVAHLYPGTWNEAGPATIASYICHLRRKLRLVWISIDNHHAARFSLRDDLGPQHAPCPLCKGTGVSEKVAA